MGRQPITTTRYSGAEFVWGVSLSAAVHGLLIGTALAVNPWGRGQQTATSPVSTERDSIVVILPSATKPPSTRAPAIEGTSYRLAPSATARRVARRIALQRPTEAVTADGAAPPPTAMVSEAAEAAPKEIATAPTVSDTGTAGGGRLDEGSSNGRSAGHGFRAGCCVGGSMGQGHSDGRTSTSVKTAARPVVSPRPPYPREARLAGWEGTVVLQLLIDVDGHVAHVTVAGSSGHAVLDESAVATARKWQFAPALDDGHPTAKVHEIRFRFRLDDHLG